MIYLQLFWEFFKISAVSFGGMASIPFLFDLSQRYHWFTVAELSDMIAVGESTPGPIAINMATFAGFKTAGIPGSLIATLGLMAPPILFSLLMFRMLKQWGENPWAEAAFSGLRPATAGLLAAAGVSLILLAIFGSETFGADMVLNWKALIFFLLLTPAVFRWPQRPLIYILIGAAAGILFQF